MLKSDSFLQRAEKEELNSPHSPTPTFILSAVLGGKLGWGVFSPAQAHPAVLRSELEFESQSPWHAVTFLSVTSHWLLLDFLLWFRDPYIAFLLMTMLYLWQVGEGVLSFSPSLGLPLCGVQVEPLHL